MAIERQNREIWFLCDHCSDSIETERISFAGARIVAEDEGWKWLGNSHYCPDCWQTHLDQAKRKLLNG